MKFNIEQDKDWLIFSLKEKKLDAKLATQLKAEFLVMAQTQFNLLVIDMSEVERCDSAGLGALLFAHRMVGERGAVLRIAAPQKSVLALIKLSLIDRVVEVFPTVKGTLKPPIQQSVVPVDDEDEVLGEELELEEIDPGEIEGFDEE